MILNVAGAGQIGIAMRDATDAEEGLEVMHVGEGPVRQWNASHPDKEVRVGDFIVRAGGGRLKSGRGILDFQSEGRLQVAVRRGTAISSQKERRIKRGLAVVLRCEGGSDGARKGGWRNDPGAQQGSGPQNRGGGAGGVQNDARADASVSVGAGTVSTGSVGSTGAAAAAKERPRCHHQGVMRGLERARRHAERKAERVAGLSRDDGPGPMPLSSGERCNDDDHGENVPMQLREGSGSGDVKCRLGVAVGGWSQGQLREGGSSTDRGACHGAGGEGTPPGAAQGPGIERDAPRAGESTGEVEGRRGTARRASELDGSDAAARRVASRVESVGGSRRPSELGAQATFDDDSWWD